MISEPSSDRLPPSKEIEELLRPVRKVMAALLRSDAIHVGDVDEAIRQVTEVAAQVLRVARASVWTFEKEANRIVCVDLFEANKGTHARGAIITAVQAPRYFEALEEARSIAAHDAKNDPRTREFAHGYLDLHGIGAMLDVPVLLRGTLVGIVCYEHVGPLRKWSFWEELVACTLADYVAMVLGASEHVEQQRELSEYRMRLEQLVEVRTAALARAEHDLRTAFDASPVCLIVTRVTDHRVVAANRRAAEIFEIPMDRILEVRSIDFWVDLDDRSRAVTELVAKGHVSAFRTRMRTATGRVFWAELDLRFIERDGEKCFLAGLRDVSDQKRAEDVLVKSRDTLQTLFEAAPMPMVLTRLEDGVIRQCNERASAMFGLPLERVIGSRAPDYYYDASERAEFIELLRKDGRVEGFTVRLRSHEGSPFWVLMNARLLEVEQERCFFVGFADLTAQKKLEQRLQELASTDPLTGALNRRRFAELAQAELDRSDRYGHAVSFAMLDADDFKALNDSRGHAEGDRALVKLAEISGGVLRRIDLFGRYGGEEFVVLFPETTRENALVVAERLRRAVEAESTAAGLPFTISIGLAERQSGETLEAVLRRVDLAVYAAKRQGKNRICLG